MGLGAAGAAAAVSAGVGAAGSIGGAAISSSAASSASKAQQATSLAALQQQDATNAFNRANTQDFVNAGINGVTRQQGLIDGFSGAIAPYQDALTAATPGNFDQNALAATPGYQFTLAQGLKSTQNAAAARGLGVSGAALKGAAAYATGLSDQTYNTRFGQAQTKYTDASNNLSQALGVYGQNFNQNQQAINVGENAAVGSGTTNQAGATNSGNLLTGSGNAQGAADLAGASAAKNGITGATNALSGLTNNPLFYNALAGSGSQYPSSATGNPNSNNYNPENGY